MVVAVAVGFWHWYSRRRLLLTGGRPGRRRAGLPTSAGKSAEPAGIPQASRPDNRPIAEGAAKTMGLAGLPPAAQAAVSATMGRESGAYHAVALGDGFQTQNPKHELAAVFTAAGVEVRNGAASWGLALRGYGYGNALAEVSSASPEASGNRVEYRRGPLTEWYVKGPLGLEQGFTLAAPPGEQNDGPLTLALSGDLTAAVEPGGNGLTLLRADGQAALRYRGLSAYDASGRVLPAWLQMQGGQLLLLVDDAGASYPLVVDPFVEQAKLTSGAGGFFGNSVAVSGDTVVVGANFDNIGANGDQGSVYAFVKPLAGWANMTQTQKLTASDGTASAVGSRRD